MPRNAPRRAALPRRPQRSADASIGALGERMHFKHRMFAVAGVAAALLVFAGAPAWAAPPSNDTFAGAQTIGALPFSATVDTTQATTDADDTAANTNCGAPATAASVWYAFTPAADGGRIVDVSSSN